MNHAATLTIDLAALVENWKSLARRVGPARCGAAIKADAYGLGLEPVASALIRAGCRDFFVAHDSEAARLLALAPETIVYVLNGIGTARPAAARPVIGNETELTAWLKHAAPAPFALQFNIGMNRLGFEPHQAESVRAALGTHQPSLILGHFSSSEDSASPATARETALFAKVRACFPDVPASLANSSGHFLPGPFYDLTRPGYALYGGNPTPGQANPMRPVLSLTSPILQMRTITPGETVGYNTLWTARRPTRLATCSIGYADGLPRAARGIDSRPGGTGYIDGHPCPIVGTISMDLTVFDITDAPEALCRPGTLIELLGPHCDIDTLASAANTIGYELLIRLGRRFNRVYRDL